jgi:hypothetical protein
VSDDRLRVRSYNKKQALDFMLSYADEYQSELDMSEDAPSIRIQRIERHFLKLFGIVL